MFSYLFFWDRVLIIGFMIFITAIIIGILYVNIPVIQNPIKRRINRFIEKLESMTAWLSDYDEYDSEWMDYESWKKTNL